jgi:hypothetical protein
MRFIIIIIISIFSSAIFSQESLYKKSPKTGKYDVGYTDTIIYKNNEQFSYNSINIKKPFFTHIWYPCQKPDKDTANFQYKDYWTFQSTEDEQILIDSMISTYYNSTFHDPVLPALLINKSIKIFYKAKYKEGKFPVVIYHHGSQGVGIENSHLCEYLASNGFIVLSTNFTLPSDIVPKLIPSSTFKTKYNLSDIDAVMMEDIEHDMNNAEMKNLDFIINIATNLNHFDKKNLYGIGHSRGAQRLVLMDRDSINRFSKIIALHTTYEDDIPSDICQIRSYDCNIINNNLNNFTTNKYFFAPIRIEKETIIPPNFTFHRILKNSTFIEIKYPLDHNSFVFDYVYYNVNKGNISKKELKYYFKINKLIVDILNNNISKSSSNIKISNND